ncbi:hypothetical protein CR513_07576, partial [Mucuna pruriens]
MIEKVAFALVTISQHLRPHFQSAKEAKASRKNDSMAKYESLTTILMLALEVGTKRVMCKSNSQLVVGQVSREFQAKEPHMFRYCHNVIRMLQNFEAHELKHIPRDENTKVDLLAKLASTKKPWQHHIVIQKTIKSLYNRRALDLE